MQKVSNFKQFLISLLFHFKYLLITLNNISINESPYAFDLGHSKSLKMKKYPNLQTVSTSHLTNTWQNESSNIKCLRSKIH